MLMKKLTWTLTFDQRCQFLYLTHSFDNYDKQPYQVSLQFNHQQKSYGLDGIWRLRDELTHTGWFFMLHSWTHKNISSHDVTCYSKIICYIFAAHKVATTSDGQTFPHIQVYKIPTFPWPEIIFPRPKVQYFRKCSLWTLPWPASSTILPSWFLSYPYKITTAVFVILPRQKLCFSTSKCRVSMTIKFTELYINTCFSILCWIKFCCV